MLDPRDANAETSEFEFSLRQAAEAAASGINPALAADQREKNYERPAV
jgi:hypothetical protein